MAQEFCCTVYNVQCTLHYVHSYFSISTSSAMSVSLYRPPRLHLARNLHLPRHLRLPCHLYLPLCRSERKKKFNEGKGIEKFGACSLLLKRSHILANTERKRKNVFYTKIARSNDKWTSISMVRDHYRLLHSRRPWFVLFTTFILSISYCSHLMRYM